MTATSNKPAAGNAGIASRFTIGHHWPGVPETGRWAAFAHRDMNDTAKEIDALDCKADPRHLDRLFTYLVRKQAHRLGLKPERLYELVAEAELRKAVRKAVDRFRTEVRSITCFASWWLSQGIRRNVRTPAQPFTLVQPLGTGRSL